MGQEKLNTLEKRPFQIKDEREFEQLAIDLFNYQYDNVSVYKNYCDLLKVNPKKVLNLTDIPFLPISAFKHHKVLVDKQKTALSFKSSGTTQGNLRSVHHLSNPAIYEKSLLETFNSLVGSINELRLFSLLPGYEENKESSLIYMLKVLSQKSIDGKIHRFPNDHAGLISELENSTKNGVKNILFGVSFALMDLAESFDSSLPTTSIIETGGMKGNRKEITRHQLHNYLRLKLRPKYIHSEYGMTELFSQAYAINSEWFTSPPWFRVFVRDVYDPLTIKCKGSGALNIIDLANINSCAFIASDDLGKLKENKTFKVLGRFDHSDIRGCNLLHLEN